MARPPRSALTRRAAPGLHHIKSPLSRVAYAMPQGRAHLLWLDYGQVSLRTAPEDRNREPVGPQHNRDHNPEHNPEHRGPRLLWWADGAGREMLASVGTRGTLLSVPAAILMQALPTTPIGEQMQRTLSQDLELSIETATPIAHLLAGYAQEKQSGEPGADLATQHYVALILLQLWRLARKDLVSLGGAPQGLSERFILMAGQRARDHLPVDAYARELQVSRDRLGSAVKRATGLSPRAYLHRLLLRDAMEMLANSGMPVSQVAFRLGFADPAYFTRFFKREIGQNPGAFRKSYRRRDLTGPQSFAEWP